jgi:hypothetical protein
MIEVIDTMNDARPNTTGRRDARPENHVAQRSENIVSHIALRAPSLLGSDLLATVDGLARHHFVRAGVTTATDSDTWNLAGIGGLDLVTAARRKLRLRSPLNGKNRDET